MSPWLDLRVPPKEVKLPEVAAQTHRRFLKTHLPVDALVFSDKAKYVYIGRDGRDVVWSLHNHFSRANGLLYELLNETPGRVGPEIGRPPAAVVQYFREWLAFDGYPLWSFWDNVRTWWAIRDLPNVHFLHFANLKDDLEGEIRRLAAFLGIAIDERRMPAILEHCSFAYMKAKGSASTPLGGALWEGGSATFVHKGTNGRWRDELPLEDSVAYERRAIAELGQDAAAWLLSAGADRRVVAGGRGRDAS
jgi:aryl sulfotransferase